MSTQGDKLRAILELKDPALRVQRLMGERVVMDALVKLEAVQGPTGEQGYTPVKGKDYFTNEEIQAFVDYIRSQIKDGAVGKDGTPGIRGKDGDTPILGVDYFTPEHKEKIVKDVIRALPKQRAPKVPTVADVAAEFRKNPINYEEIANAPDLTDLPKLIQFLKMGGFRGGGSGSSSSGGAFTSLSATETPNGNISVFTFSAAVAQPSYILSDGVLYAAVDDTGVTNWAWNSGTLKATLSIPPPTRMIKAIV